LKVCGILRYDGLIPLEEMQARVNKAINGYLLNLPFDGVFRRNDLIKSVCRLENVIDFEITDLCASVAYDSVPAYMNIGQSYRTESGCLEVDKYFPLTDKVQYVAQPNC